MYTRVGTPQRQCPSLLVWYCLDGLDLYDQNEPTYGLRWHFRGMTRLRALLG